MRQAQHAFHALGDRRQGRVADGHAALRVQQPDAQLAVADQHVVDVMAQVVHAAAPRFIDEVADDPDLAGQAVAVGLFELVGQGPVEDPADHGEHRHGAHPERQHESLADRQDGHGGGVSPGPRHSIT